MLSFEFLLRLSAILKLDFLKTLGTSGSARPPRGMKLRGNFFELFQHCYLKNHRYKSSCIESPYIIRYIGHYSRNCIYSPVAALFAKNRHF